MEALFNVENLSWENHPAVKDVFIKKYYDGAIWKGQPIHNNGKNPCRGSKYRNISTKKVKTFFLY